jgi:hypothetical protein
VGPPERIYIEPSGNVHGFRNLMGAVWHWMKYGEARPRAAPVRKWSLNPEPAPGTDG